MMALLLLCVLLTLSSLALAQLSPALVRFTQLAPPPGSFNGTNSTTNRNCTVSMIQLVCNGTNILFNGDLGPTQGYNVSRAFAWSQNFNMTFTFMSVTNITKVTLFFANQPSIGVGLPQIDGLFSNTSNPLNFTIAGNQDLSQNDTGLRNISLIITSNVNRYINFSIRFSFPSSILVRTLLLSEVQLYNTAVSPPPMGNISFLPHPPVVTLGTGNPQGSYNLSCTVVNAGSFEWNWTFPASIQYQMWIGDGTRTSVVKLSNISSNYSGNYVCLVRYKSQTSFVANSTIKLKFNIAATSSVSIIQQSPSQTLQLKPTSSPLQLEPTSSFPGSSSQDTSTGSLAAGLVVGIIIIIVLVTVLVVLFVLLYLKRCKNKDFWIATKTFMDVKINEPKEVQGNGTEVNTNSDIEMTQPPAILAWNGQEEPKYEEQDIAIDNPAYGYQKRVLIGPSKVGKLVQITDTSGYIFTVNPHFAPDEVEESCYENVDITKRSQPKKILIKKIKPVDIQYQMESVVATVPERNMITIPEALAPSSLPEQGSARKRCLTGPSKPAKLAVTTEAALQNMAWSFNALYSSSGCNIYDLPPHEGDPVDDSEDPDHIYSVALDPTLSLQDPKPSIPIQDPTDHFPFSSIYANLSNSEKPLRISPENIHEIELLGEGQFGEVLLAEVVGLSLECLGISTGGSASSKVSVKRLKENTESSALDAFKKEIKFMSCLNHENVVRLLAVHEGSESSTPFIVMEHMENGDLCKFLQKHELSSSLEEGHLSPYVLLCMATQIANGMRYLASFNFVHRDLATRNCLVGKDYVVKIADFGMAANLYESAYCCIRGQAKLPIRWMPTESFFGQFSEKSDIWSFGVVVWEIYGLAQTLPYADMDDHALIEDATLGQARSLLTIPESCPSEVYDIMMSCWSHDPAKRPTFEEVYQALLSYLHTTN